MAVLQNVPINLAVLHFHAYNPACLLFYLLKLAILLKLNVGEHPFPVYCYLLSYTVCIFFLLNLL